MALPLYLFDITYGDIDEQIKEESEIFDAKKGKHLRCRICLHIITDEGQGISIAGGHTHIHANPAGIEYQIRCFRNTTGYGASGTATEKFIWFAGYKWQVAVCNTCGKHLGWLFKRKDRFCGLIHSQLPADSDRLD